MVPINRTRALGSELHNRPATICGIIRHDDTDSQWDGTVRSRARRRRLAAPAEVRCGLGHSGEESLRPVRSHRMLQASSNLESTVRSVDQSRLIYVTDRIACPTRTVYGPLDVPVNPIPQHTCSLDCMVACYPLNRSRFTY